MDQITTESCRLQSRSPGSFHQCCRSPHARKMFSRGVFLGTEILFMSLFYNEFQLCNLFWKDKRFCIMNPIRWLYSFMNKKQFHFRKSETIIRLICIYLDRRCLYHVVKRGVGMLAESPRQVCGTF